MQRGNHGKGPAKDGGGKAPGRAPSQPSTPKGTAGRRDERNDRRDDRRDARRDDRYDESRRRTDFMSAGVGTAAGEVQQLGSLGQCTLLQCCNDTREDEH